MYIYGINNLNFTAKPNKKITIDQEVLDRFKNNTYDNVKKEFYNNIDLFINKKFSKKEFLENINKIAHKIDNKVKLNDAEKQYIDDMVTTMDLSGKKLKIPDKYLLENIYSLFKNQQ